MDDVLISPVDGLFRTAHPIRQIKSWFRKAVPRPTNQNTHSQIGVHLEEVAEMLQLLQSAGANQRVRDELQLAVDVINHVQRQIKGFTEGSEILLKYLNREEILDALCDQIVTAVGVAHMLDMDIENALLEVARSNDSKFDQEGKPIFNEQKKILKGPNYTPPHLTPYV
jgi:NTP pyrophosphatase (non-canonical NTP hydrolase)